MAHADGALGGRDEARLREHLEACQGCRRTVEALSRLEFDLEGLSEETPEPPPFLKARVLARVSELERPRRWRLGALFTSRGVLAVSTACLAFFAGLLAREVHRVNDWMRGGGRREVVLEYQSAGAREVALAGDFNQWGRDGGGVRAERVGDRWVFRLRLAPGRYQYAFVVDGKTWLPDPGAPGIIPDGFGGRNSVLYVPHSSTSPM